MRDSVSVHIIQESKGLSVPSYPGVKDSNQDPFKVWFIYTDHWDSWGMVTCACRICQPCAFKLCDVSYIHSSWCCMTHKYEFAEFTKPKMGMEMACGVRTKRTFEFGSVRACNPILRHANIWERWGPPCPPASRGRTPPRVLGRP